MKRSKTLITLLSMAVIGLSSTAVMADGQGDMDRIQARLNEAWKNVEISPELQELVEQFRANRETLMIQFRELREQHREAMSGVWADLKAAKESGDQEAINNAVANLRAKRDELRAEYLAENGVEFGDDLKEVRLQLRDLKRQVREEIRKQRGTVDAEG